MPKKQQFKIPELEEQEKRFNEVFGEAFNKQGKVKKDTEVKEGVAAPEVYRDNTGKIVGFVKDGKAFFGFDDQEARDYLERQNRINQTPTGAIEVGEAAKLREGAELAKDIGNLTPEQRAEIEGVGTSTKIFQKQATQAGVAGGVKGAITGGVTGVTVGGGTGFATGGPAGVIVGGAIGGLGGATLGALKSFFSGYTADLEQQARGEVGASTTALTKAETDLRKIAALAWSDRADKVTLVKAFNERLTDVEREHTKLKLDTKKNKKFALDDGTRALQRYESFYSTGGVRDLVTAEFIAALSSPSDENRSLALLNSADFNEVNIENAE